jgi:hypothetical protein
MSQQEADLRKRFTRQPASADQAKRQELINQKSLELCLLIAEVTPQSREQSVAFTNIEQAAMWANKAISKNEVEA